ncbi:serine/threonine protein kinase, partial [Nocardiopsis sp. MG754419]|nr:serine/threonine protein kinase [Nocardiopsis sp. MG754419]
PHPAPNVTGAPSPTLYGTADDSGPRPAATGAVTAPDQRSRRLSWPVVVLTLGLATLVVATSLVVLGPWRDGGPTLPSELDGGAAEDGAGVSEDTTSDPVETGESPASDLGALVETDDDGTPVGAGMTWTEDPEGFAMLVPDGWVRRTDGASVFYDSPADSSYLQIDRTGHPTDDEYAHVQEQDATNRMPGYERIRIDDVTDDTPFASAADWEFTSTQNGVTRHMLARNIAVTSGDHYTVLFVAEQERWADQADWCENAMNSFDPF